MPIIKTVHKALEQLKATHDTTELAIVLEGSIAEGFGNTSSDIDFMCIVPGSMQLSTMPETIYVDGMRVETRFRSQTQISTDIDTIVSSDVSTIKEINLDKLQRFLYSEVMQGHPLIDTLKDSLPVDCRISLFHRWHVHQANAKLRYAKALALLDCTEQAGSYLRVGLSYAIKAVLALKGELYVSRKWIFHQMARAGFNEVTVSEIHSALLSNTLPSWSQCESIFAKIGFDWSGCDLDTFSISRHEDCSQWQLDGRSYLVRGEDVYALEHSIAQLIAQLSEATPLLKLLPQLQQANLCHQVVLLNKLGLLSFWLGKEKINSSGADLQLPASNNILHINGAQLTKAEPIVRLPYKSTVFAYSGVTLHYVNISIENIKNDLIGGEKEQNWDYCAQRLNEMLRQTAFLTWCALAVLPPPPLEEKWDDAVLGFQWFSQIPQRLKQQYSSLSSAGIKDDKSFNLARSQIYDFTDNVRQFCAVNCFDKDIYSDAQALNDAYLAGMSWMSLAKQINADFPIIEVKDLADLFEASLADAQQGGENEKS